MHRGNEIGDELMGMGGNGYEGRRPLGAVVLHSSD